MKPLVSIISATYNRAEFLPALIAAVRKQTYDQWELVLVDDASTDATRVVILPYLASETRLKYIRAECNGGAAAARNRGLAAAQGELIAVLDSDDVWVDASKLRDQVELFMDRPQLVLVGGGMQKVTVAGNVVSAHVPPATDAELRTRMLMSNPFFHSTVMYRREALRQMGGYNERLTFAEDYDAWLRLGLRGELGALPRVVTNYLVHTQSLTTEHGLKAAQATLSVMKRYRAYYPHAYQALMWGYARIARAYIGSKKLV